LDARRDWGYAPEYVNAMWKMLQVDEPNDFVIGTGTDFSVRDFLKLAFESAGLNWENHVRFDDRYLRPTEVDSLIADPSFASKNLDWKAKIMPNKLAEIMVEHDIAILNGYKPDKPICKPWV
jgi:GDPmannose 4,6-dehydratase